MIFVVILLIMQYVLGSKLKRKTSLLDNGIKQLLFYVLLVIIVSVLPALLIGSIDIVGIILMILTLLIGFLVLNYSELWYRMNMFSLGEFEVKLKFLNLRSETNPTNLYESISFESRPISEIITNNVDLVLKLTKTEIFEVMVALFKAKHPDKMKNLKGKDENEQLLEIFEVIYEGFFMHQVFFPFWFLDPDIELRSDIQALILSTKEKLPRDLMLTCCVLREEGKFGKKFSVIHGIEGIIDENLAKRLRIYESDFEFFKFLPDINNVDSIIRERDFYKIQYEALETDFYDLIGNKLSMDVRINRLKQYKLRKKEDRDFNE